MKYTAAAGVPQGREVISLSPKLASATYSEGFNIQYNSPKTLPAKGFVLPKSNKDDITLLRAKKSESTGVQSKSKGTQAYQLGVGNSTPTQKRSGNLTVSTQLPGSRDDKKSSSATKLKGESLRTVSSTPKNTGACKTSENLKSREETSYNPTQKWKKLEISTEYNTKATYGIKAQTTKNTETDENGLAKSSVTQQSLQSLAKSLQTKNSSSSNNFSAYYMQNNSDRREEKPSIEIKFEQKFRTNRPQSGKDAKASAVSPKGPANPEGQARNTSVKESAKVNNFFQEATGSRSSYRRNTPTNSATRVANESASKKTAQLDLRASWQASTETAKKRPLSAKKPARAESKEPKEEVQVERANLRADKTPTQKTSLQSFVTKIDKGDVFGSIKKYGEKRDNSLRRNQKPTLDIDEKVSKPVKAIELDLKGSKTTTNSESKKFAVSLARGTAQAASQQTMPPKNSKNTKSGAASAKETMRSSKELLGRNAQDEEPFVYYMSSLDKAHRWNGDQDYFAQVYREHFLQSYQALSFCKTLKPTDPSVIAQKRVNLPRRESHKGKKTLVFDMDETLIHCNESLDMPADVVLPICFPNGEVVEAGINVRPYALECLRELSQKYEIIVFTASHSCYANVVLDYLDPHEQYIHHRLFRESCVVTDEGVHIKDLRVIGNRNLQDMVLIDNAAYSFGFQIENGIPIIPFYDNKNDQELRHLTPYLKFLNSVKDVRDIVRQTFKMHEYGAHDSPDAVLERVIAQE